MKNITKEMTFKCSSVEHFENSVLKNINLNLSLVKKKVPQKKKAEP